MIKAAFLATTLLLAGCTHTSNVQDVGNGMHAVTATANWGGYTGSREETIAQANDFCAGSDRRAAIEHFEDKPGVSPQGERTSALTFTCTARMAWQLR